MSECTEITDDQIRAINARAMQAIEQHELQQLRDEVARLTADYVKLFKLAEPIAKMLGELSIQPIGCSREQELAWKMAVKNLRHYQRDNASDELQAALDGGKGVQGET